MISSESTPRDVLESVKTELARQGYAPTGPHSCGDPGKDFLTLADGRRVRAWRDEAGLWQLLIYAGPHASLVSMADPDGRDFPGDRV